MILSTPPSLIACWNHHWKLKAICLQSISSTIAIRAWDEDKSWTLGKYLRPAYVSAVPRARREPRPALFFSSQPVLLLPLLLLFFFLLFVTSFPSLYLQSHQFSQEARSIPSHLQNGHVHTPHTRNHQPVSQTNQPLLRNITYHASALTRTERSSLRNQRGLTIWLTGLSASGKSTIAVELEHQLLRERGVSAYRLDGDNVRFGLNKDLGFSDADRNENIRRIAEVAKLFADSASIAITSFISPFRADRDTARKLHEVPTPGEETGLPFVEVHIDVPIEVAEQRDPKGLYKKARDGVIKEFTGISSPYEAPEKPEVHVKNVDLPVQEAVKQIIAYLDSQGYLPPKKE